MSRVSFSTLRTAAEKELKDREKKASISENNIGSRRNNLSHGKLIGSILGVVALSVLLLAGLLYVGSGELGFRLSEEYAPYIYLACGAAIVLFAVVMVIRDVGLMAHFGVVFRALNEVSDLRKGLSSHLQGLANEEKKFNGAKSKGWDLELKLPQDVPARIRQVERETLSQADERNAGLNKFLVVLFYIGMVICGIVAASACYVLSHRILHWVLNMIAGLTDMDGLTDISHIAATIAVILGIVAQFWPAKWYVTAHEDGLSWWAPIVFATGAVTTLLATVALGLVAAALGLIVFLIAIAIAIGAVVLGFYLVSIFCCGG